MHKINTTVTMLYIYYIAKNMLDDGIIPKRKKYVIIRFRAAILNSPILAEPPQHLSKRVASTIPQTGTLI